MEILVQFIKTSQELRKLLEQDFEMEKREELMEQINQLLHTRQQHLNEFPDLSSLKEETKAELMKLEKEIQTLMESKKELIKTDLKNLQIQKKKGQNYSEPYGNISADGMFLDKKK